MKFLINFDIFNPKLTTANAFHFCVSAIFTLLWGFWVAWAIGIIWEIGDGFKPWYWQAPKNTGWLKRELFYSDKFSLQDVFIWDLGGCLLGAVIAIL